MEVLGSSAGIQFAIVELAGSDSALAKQAREVRKSLHHGFGTIYDESKNLPELVPVLRNALLLALADVIGLPREYWPRLLRSMYPRPTSLGEFTAKVTLYGLPVSVLLQCTAVPEVTLQLIPPSDADPAAAEDRRTFGIFRLGMKNHEGRWGNGELQWVGHGDPDSGQT